MIETPSVQYNPNKIVFVGNMRTLQNQDAVLFFVQEVFPRILSRQPDTIFYIVGAALVIGAVVILVTRKRMSKN
jgi:hypothetical protein